MNVAVQKTKAERAIGEHFATVNGRLAEASWAKSLRSDAFAHFQAFGLPHRRIEQWKYTDLRERLKEAYPPPLRAFAAASQVDIERALGPLAAIKAYRLVFLDGSFSAALSDAEPLAQWAEFVTLAAVLRGEGAGVRERLAVRGFNAAGAVRALNLAFMSDGAVFTVRPEARVDRPVMLVFARVADTPTAITTRNIVRVGGGAALSLIEVHVALPGASPGGQENAATDLLLQRGANVRHVKCLPAGADGVHLSNTDAELGESASLRSLQMTLSGALVRNELAISFKGKGAKLDASGAMLAAGSQHLDTTLFVDHEAPAGVSRELYKSVLSGRARAVFQGKIIVHPGAQKTDGKQMAQGLMLSPEAEFDSKPELEIYADDVACGHGSTCAEIDPDLVFYCRSRGIPENEARALLVRSFIAEAVEKVEEEPVREALMTLAEGWLQQRTS
ncbi:MAG TPA: Fe-S cluster assembly protein SufD [Hyphomicrobiaceae bacterium]|nr:Fe-S cluster assembly protein SufD [Hyphomicrobiaceae bacterium]